MVTILHVDSDHVLVNIPFGIKLNESHPPLGNAVKHRPV